MTKKNDDLSFEDSFQKLEEIVQTLEAGDSKLEESLTLFQEGMKLVNFCTEKLNMTELKLQELIKNDDNHFEIRPLD